MPSSDKLKIVAGARASPLSLAQMEEVQKELRQHHPHVELETLALTTVGDRDLKTSLRTLDKTDFFTKDIDAALLEGRCRIAIHSAKDLPDPLPAGISIIALTKGVDCSDSLVLRSGETLESLPSGARIATSSIRREEAVRQRRQDLSFIDVRGTIHQRLALLDKGEADGVVIAEAALIRLELTGLNRVTLPGDTTPLQGRLAIAARAEDFAMAELFSCLDTRPIHLHVGMVAPTSTVVDVKTVHFPLIQTVPREVNIAALPFDAYTHLVFTSKTAVDNLVKLTGTHPLKGKIIIAVGAATAEVLKKHDLEAVIAQEATAEGVCELLDTMSLEKAYVFWPHSAQARPVIAEYLTGRRIKWDECILYDTLPSFDAAPPSLEQVTKVHFTSPSCIAAFKQCYGSLPSHIEYVCIGPVTKAALMDMD